MATQWLRQLPCSHDCVPGGAPDSRSRSSTSMRPSGTLLWRLRPPFERPERVITRRVRWDNRCYRKSLVRRACNVAPGDPMEVGDGARTVAPRGTRHKVTSRDPSRHTQIVDRTFEVIDVFSAGTGTSGHPSAPGIPLNRALSVCDIELLGKLELPAATRRAQGPVSFASFRAISASKQYTSSGKASVRGASWRI